MPFNGSSLVVGSKLCYAVSARVVVCRRACMPFRLSSSRLHSSPYLSNSVQFRGHSHRLASIRCLIAAVHVGSPQRPVDSVRHVCHRRHAAAHPRLSWRCHFVPCLSDSRQLIAVMCPAVAVPIKSLPHCAVPFLFFAPVFPAIPLRCRSDQSLARQFSAFSSLFWSLPCRFVSTHLRFCRSWPFLCCSLPVRAEPCPFLSIPLGSIPFRVRSDPYASARLGAVSHRVSTARCRIGSDQFQSQHRKSMAIRLKPNPG